MQFKLKRPCKTCPFRSDRYFPLHPERVKQIMMASGFSCHNTVNYEDRDDEAIEHVRGEGEQECAGRLILLEKMGFPDQQMRIAERLGIYDRTQLDMDAPVYDHVDDYLAAIEEHGS